MNGVHDLGGMHGFGPVTIERDEPVFHEEWERRVFAMLVAVRMAGHWNIDQSRFAREQMPPVDYLASTYYERWLYGFQQQLEERELVSRAEVAARIDDPASPFEDVPDALDAVSVDDLQSRSGSRNASKSDEVVAARFRVGDRVMTRLIQPVGHTRLPRYARGRQGVVTRDHGVWVLPDSSGNDLGPNPQHCYCVRFDARELWGDEARAGDAVYVDLWDDHLVPS